jgi:UDP-glucose:(heptosyl)LPS alpha-1,3-glucosyltransferase
MGLSVTVVCDSASATLEADHDRTLPTVRRIENQTGNRATRTIRFVRGADEFCRMEHFDVVHAITPCFSANVYQPRGGTYVETVARSVARGRTPVGRWLKRLGRRFNRRQRFLLLLERNLLTQKHPPLVAAVSDYVRRQVQSAFGLSAAQVSVVFNGVDIEPLAPDEVAEQRTVYRQRMGLSGDQTLVLFVAHNFKLKGLAELIRARAAHPDAAWTVAVAGRDDPTPYLNLASRLGVHDAFQFIGVDHAMPALYAAADLLAHPTWYDPCSRVVLEALSCGTPVVTTRFNGAAEVMEADRHGVVIDSPDDADALADAITRCLTSEIRETCRRDAATLRERLSMERHARELAVLYERLVQAAPHAKPQAGVLP